MTELARRDCATCRECLLLEPSYQDRKNGLDAVISCCLHPKVRIKMSDGVYPKLTEIVRRNRNLCGPEGRWWELDAPTVSAEYKPSAKQRAEGEKVVHVKPPRSPYQVQNQTQVQIRRK